MIRYPDRLSFFLISSYIILLLYYSLQLLFYTDEFAINNLGSFNHSIAGLCEIIGIIFLSLSIGLFLTIIIGPKFQMIIYITVLIMQIFITLNFWRYILTNSPGESNIETITYNALIFSFMSLLLIIAIFRLRKYLFTNYDF
tara:strand:+ start:214 stop:639 length:426 start_codon:yes stop_codon:yes gene_type:complete